MVDVKKTGDADLSCKQIESEIAEADRFEKEARDEKGVTGKNVAAAVLFWPALIGTYHNAEEAIEAAQDRKENLLKLSEEKDVKL